LKWLERPGETSGKAHRRENRAETPPSNVGSAWSGYPFDPEPTVELAEEEADDGLADVEGGA
jgi:hypothetical protein